MLIDLKIPIAFELQRKAAVLRQLLQHVIEEPDARRSRHRPRRIKIHPHLNRSLLGLPGELTPSREQLLHRCRPARFGSTLALNPHSPEREVPRELEIRLAVADDRTGSKVDLPRP